MLNLESTTKEEAFEELAAAITGIYPECDHAEMLAALWEREQKLSTGIIPGVAIPHAICKGIKNMAGAIGVSKTGIEYDSLDNKPVHVIFMLAMGENAKEHHLRTLNMIFRLVKSEALATITNAKNPRDIEAVLSRFQ
jgi:mannitol/fructose-specific phosphotransferase system IIA component (Ntr-type)